MTDHSGNSKQNKTNQNKLNWQSYCTLGFLAMVRREGRRLLTSPVTNSSSKDIDVV